MGVLIPRLIGPANVYDDCQGVVGDAQRPYKDAVKGSRKHAGVIFHWSREPEKLALATIHKVKAHQNWKVLEDPVEKARAKGHAEVDQRATDANKRHPQADPEAIRQLDLQISLLPSKWCKPSSCGPIGQVAD